MSSTYQLTIKCDVFAAVLTLPILKWTTNKRFFLIDNKNSVPQN